MHLFTIRSMDRYLFPAICGKAEYASQLAENWKINYLLVFVGAYEEKSALCPFFLYQTSCPVNKIYINWGIWNEDHTFSPSGMRVSKLFYNYSVILLLMSIETDALHSILCQQCLVFISQPYKVDCSDIPLKFLAMKKESSFNQPRSCIVLRLRPH